jgi:hypothetical protein
VERYAHAIFCDDIRQEVGNKQSYMGVYISEMILPSLPFILQKLCCQVSVVTPIERPFQKLVFRLLKDDQVIGEKAVASEMLGTLPDSPHAGPLHKEQRILTSISTFLLLGLRIEQPCVFRIRVETEEGEIKANGLSVFPAPTAQDT